MTTATATTRPAERLRTYASFVRLEHTLFSLPLLLAGVFSQQGQPLPLSRWLLGVVAAVGARTAAMTMNRLIDRKVDALNPRTASRELPSGRMRALEGGMLLLVSLGAYLAACVALGPLYLTVSAIPIAVFAVYPYLKRFTPFCHVGVGAAMCLAALAGWALAHPGLERPLPAVLLAVFALLWGTGFDIIYATLDETFDRGHGVHSMVVWLGRARALRVSALLHRLCAVAAFGAALAVMRDAGGVTLAGLAAVFPVWIAIVVLLTLEQRWAEDVNVAFFKVNVWVSAAVCGMVLVARLASGGF
jgi:4-hydroxybenzoate polyprenyltransferase